MVVVLAIVGTALGAVFGMIQGMFRGMALTERTLEVQQNARGAVDRVVEELRWAEEVLPDAPCGGLCPDRISVRIAAHNPRRPGQTYVVTFQRDPLQRELERRLSGAVNNLAGSIDGLAFRYFDAGGAPTSTPQEVVRVEVTVAAGSAPPLAVSRMVATDVFLRNHPPASPVPP
jgi:type II secretory pathway pseudopilin PulG